MATKLIDAYQNAPTPLCFLVVEHFHGAAVRVDPSATAFRTAKQATTASSSRSGATQPIPKPGIRWAQATYESLRPHMTDSAYVNYLDNDDASRVRAAYGPNYDRLTDLRRKYDPDNAFRLNQNITP